MTTSTGSISLTGLLGGTAGQIDVPTLVSNLVTAASVPKQLLSDQLTTVGSKMTAYQAINTKLTAVQAAAQALTTDTTWAATTATSSSTAVVANSTAAAAQGSTTFDVVRLARAQVATIAAAADGTVVSNAPADIVVTDAHGTEHNVTVSPGTAASAAAAINNAGLGVRASVIVTDQGLQLQLTAAKTGAANGFTISGFDQQPHTLVAATDAQLAVGGADGYTASSATNTFVDVVPGVSFSVNAVATGVTVNVAPDADAISGTVQNLIASVNDAHSELASDTGLGGVLQGTFDVSGLASKLVSNVSSGTASGGSLKTYGIDVDSTGTMSFDAAAFAAAYAADPSAVRTAISALAGGLGGVAKDAVDTTTGTVTASIKGLTTTGQRLSDEIDSWTDRLADLKSQLQGRFTTMQTSLLRLQTTQSYLTSVLASIENSKESSS